jgi:hypothetical protein
MEAALCPVALQQEKQRTQKISNLTLVIFQPAGRFTSLCYES